MALLIVEQNGVTRGAVLRDRVLVGRRSMNHLLIEHPAVSRMHAWIERWERSFVITDLRSRTGTKVNGVPVGKYRPLADGDVIEIGPARLTFRTADRVPLDVEAFAIPAEPTIAARDAGIRFDCPTCTAPMWATAEFAGHEGVCVYCGHTFEIPTAADAAAAAGSAPPPPPAAKPRETAVAEAEARLETLQAKPDPSALPAARADFLPLGDAPPAAPAPAAANGAARPQTVARVQPAATPARPAAGSSATATLAPPAAPKASSATKPAPAAKPVPAAKPAVNPKCGVCHTSILPAEVRTACGTCGLKFHAECWQENYGCSAYGCPQVNALKPPEPEPSHEAAAAEATVVDESDVPPAPRTPWEFILLGVGAVAAVLAAVSFGVASLAVLVASVVCLVRTKADPDRKAGAVYGAIALSAVGTLAGAAVSYLLFVAPK